MPAHVFEEVLLMPAGEHGGGELARHTAVVADQNGCLNEGFVRALLPLKWLFNQGLEGIERRFQVITKGVRHATPILAASPDVMLFFVNLGKRFELKKLINPLIYQ